jgi:hypothetical protein
MADKWGISVKPTATYAATGGNNADLPPTCRMGDREMSMDAVIGGSTILISMPEFSATAPLYPKARASDRLRVASMPGVAKFMEESGLSADYTRIGERCRKLEGLFNRAVAAEVEFSSGHTCFFDLPPENKALVDDGILHPERAGTADALSNLPAGEVFSVPNENEDSRTRGELPQKMGDQVICYVVDKNRIVDVGGQPEAKVEREIRFRQLAEHRRVRHRVNDKARVTGIVPKTKRPASLAYGRSDHRWTTAGLV